MLCQYRSIYSWVTVYAIILGMPSPLRLRAVTRSRIPVNGNITVKFNRELRHSSFHGMKLTCAPRVLHVRISPGHSEPASKLTCCCCFTLCRFCGRSLAVFETFSREYVAFRHMRLFFVVPKILVATHHFYLLSLLRNRLSHCPGGHNVLGSIGNGCTVHRSWPLPVPEAALTG